MTNQIKQYAFPDPSKCEGREALIQLYISVDNRIEFRLVKGIRVINTSNGIEGTHASYVIPYWQEIYHTHVQYLGTDAEGNSIFTRGAEEQIV